MIYANIPNDVKNPELNVSMYGCSEPAKRKRLGRSGTFMVQWFGRWTLESATRDQSQDRPLQAQ